MSDDTTNTTTGGSNDQGDKGSSDNVSKETKSVTHHRTEHKNSDDLPKTKTGQPITQEYLDELRSEAKTHRLKVKEAEDRIAKLEKEKNELATHSVQKIEKLNSAFEKRILNAEMVILAQKEGLTDIDAFKMCDLSEVKINENGEVVGLKEVVGDLKIKKPYLFEKASNTNTGVGDVTPGNTDTKTERPTYKDKASFEVAKKKYISSLRTR